MRHRFGTLLVAAATGFAWAVVAGAPATAAATTVDFSYTGGDQFWDVPAHVCSITIHAFGASGGRNPGTDSLGGSLPGLGGEVLTTVTVVPGDRLGIGVGGKGGDASGSTPGVGGFGGGGDGGTGANGGAGGGGVSGVAHLASAVRTTQAAAPAADPRTGSGPRESTATAPRTPPAAT
jgi:hypothetical protein